MSISGGSTAATGARVLDMLGLDPDTQRVYREIVAFPARGVADVAHHLALTEEQVRAGLDQLFELALLRRSMQHGDRLRAVSPQLALQTMLNRQQSELGRLQVEIAEGQAAMTAMIADTELSRDGNHDGAEPLVGMDAIHDRLEELTHSARREVLSLMPGGAQAEDVLEAGRRNDSRLFACGVQMRVVFQDSARNDRATLAYAQWLTDAGGQVRTAPLLPPRMLIVDRTTALVPMDPDDNRIGAIQLRGQGVIAALIALFDKVWAIAIPLGADQSNDLTRGADDRPTPQERELLALLAQGLTDDSAAKRLGVSERTARRMVAALMERLGARSRFEAGLRAAQSGWL